MQTSLYKIALRFTILQLALLPVSSSWAANFSITPNAVSNTYNGTVTLQVTGLAAGETVVVQKYLDANANGVVDGGEFEVQQFNLTDGQASVFHDGAAAVTNFNVPGDMDGVSGQITAQIDFISRDFTQNIIGKFLYVVSSTNGHFTPITNSFTVTNFPFAQTLSGSVVNNGSNVPRAGILLFPSSRPGNHHDGGPGQPQAGIVADNSGNYTIHLPPGTYVPLAFKRNFLADFSAAPVVTLASNATITTNLNLIAANQTITGSFVDAGTNSIGLPGLLLPTSTDTGLIAIGFTDQNGNFAETVTGGNWNLGNDGSSLIIHGYQAFREGTNVDTTSGSVSGLSLPFPIGTALFYGRVKDGAGNPLAGIDVLTSDNTSVYEQDALTDSNGDYAVPALAGTNFWQVQVSNGKDNPSNLIFSDGAFQQGTNLSAGQAVHQSFTGLLATNQITGQVKDSNNNPISGVGMFASAIVSGQSFSINNSKTDTNGNYSMTVAQGSWNLSVNCNGDNGLSSLGYSQCPSNQVVNITTSNGVANFTVATTTTTLSGRVVRANGTPVAFMNVFAAPNGGGTPFEATTDGGGNFVMGVSGGNYMVAMNTDAISGAPSFGLVSPFLPLTVTDGVNINNFVLIAQFATGAIKVSVRNTTNNATIEGINVVGNLTLNGTNYSSGTQMTDNSGNTQLIVFNGLWQISLSGVGVPNQNILINNNTNSATFVVPFTGASPPTIGTPVRLSPTQVQFTVTGVTGKTYSVQACTALPNWTNLFFTNAASTSFSVTDSTATNGNRFYRVLTAP